MMSARIRISIPTLLVLTACALACEPNERTPGLWLQGEPGEATVRDWSFSDANPQIFLQTRTWYGLPHSVTVVCAAIDDRLYVPSLYGSDAEFPDERFWHRNVVRDPRVQLKIGERVYDRNAVLVTDAAEREAALAAFAKKYPFWRELLSKPEPERGNIVLMRMDDPTA